MDKVLTILEVSRKQDYIFASKKLRENAERSQDIVYLTGTSGDFFETAAGNAYSKTENLVNAGGGHAVFQFASREAAVEFTRRVTLAALREFPELELFAKTIDYDPGRDPKENLDALTEALEQKKARRTSSFRQLDFGMEARREPEKRTSRPWERAGVFIPPEGFSYFSEPDTDLDDNFIAVVHIDGNNMGARVENIYKSYSGKTGPESWNHCREDLQKFSKGIQADFEAAFLELRKVLASQPDAGGYLPIRPIILAGDDVCFVTTGSIGLECARIFMEKLAATANPAGGQPYAACAGVALVHQKYPFHRAYQLAEKLCDNAKKFGADLDPERRVSVMDWHIEFGQLKDSLAELRKDYQTEDQNRLELRPVVVAAPAEMNDRFPPERGYAYFRKLCDTLQGKCRTLARSKIKELRTALKQGEVESGFFLHDKEISTLLYEPLRVAYSLPQEWKERLSSKGAFRSLAPEGEKKKRCLFFDAIEMLDHFELLEEVDS